MTMKIARLVYDDQIPDLTVEKQTLAGKSDLILVTFSGKDQDIPKLVADLKPFDGLVTDYVPLTRLIISQLANCKVISMASTGWTAVDASAAVEKGIYLCAIGEYCTQEVADHTLAILLALQRRLTAFNYAVHHKKIWDWQAEPDIERIEGQMLGILGLGKIGQAVAQRARAFGLKVIA
jgi:D-3-phosphoglycerate dehydrogenase